MAVYLIVRQTQDWKNSNFGSLTFPSGYRKPEFNSNILRTVWKQLYRDSYFEFRHSLNQIVMTAWKQPIIAKNLHSIDLRELRSTIKEDDWILPTDDDDYFHPNIEEFLKENCDNYEIAQWDVICNNINIFHEVESWTKYNDFPCSNAYAIRGSVVPKLDDKELIRLFVDHGGIMKRFLHHNLSFIKFPHHQMAVYNFHSGSLSFIMNHSVTKDWQNSTQQNLVKLKPEWEWANPQLTQITNLVKSLRRTEPLKML
jgi:hypothetical protein